MNSAYTLHDPEASLVDSRQKSRIGAQVFWSIALIGPIPFVLAPILNGLSRIESLSVYVFCLSAWTAAFFVFTSVVRSRWNRNWFFPRTRTSQILAIAGIVCHVCALCLSSPLSTWLGTVQWFLAVDACRRKTQWPLETVESLARAVHVTAIPTCRGHETRSSVPASACPHGHLLPGFAWHSVPPRPFSI